MLADTVSVTPGNDSRTRYSHQFKLNHVSSNTSQFKHAFITRTIHEWNKLWRTAVNAETVISFKERLIRHQDWSTTRYNHPSVQNSMLDVLWIVHLPKWIIPCRLTQGFLQRKGLFSPSCHWLSLSESPPIFHHLYCQTDVRKILWRTAVVRVPLLSGVPLSYAYPGNHFGRCIKYPYPDPDEHTTA